LILLLTPAVKLVFTLTLGL